MELCLLRIDREVIYTFASELTEGYLAMMERCLESAEPIGCAWGHVARGIVSLFEGHYLRWIFLRICTTRHARPE